MRITINIEAKPYMYVTQQKEFDFTKKMPRIVEHYHCKKCPAVIIEEMTRREVK